MTRAQLALFALAGALVAGFAAWQFRAAGLRLATREAAIAEQRRLATELASARQAHVALQSDLAHAERQLAALAPTGFQPDPSRHRPIAAWQERLRTLRERFAADPGQRIPEMDFLSDEDWMRVALVAKVDAEDDLRQALARVRAMATSRFATRVLPAMKKYAATAKGAPPADTRMLADYADEPFDPKLLERYEVIDRERAPTPDAPRWGLRLKSAVDPDYDDRTRYYASGGVEGGTGPYAWDPALENRYRQALSAYRRSHQGTAVRDFEDLLPFFNPPLEAATAERLKRVERTLRATSSPP